MPRILTSSVPGHSGPCMRVLGMFVNVRRRWWWPWSWERIGDVFDGIETGTHTVIEWSRVSAPPRPVSTLKPSYCPPSMRSSRTWPPPPPAPRPREAERGTEPSPRYVSDDPWPFYARPAAEPEAAPAAEPFRSGGGSDFGGGGASGGWESSSSSSSSDSSSSSSGSSDSGSSSSSNE